MSSAEGRGREGEGGKEREGERGKEREGRRRMEGEGGKEGQDFSSISILGLYRVSQVSCNIKN